MQDVLTKGVAGDDDSNDDTELSDEQQEHLRPPTPPVTAAPSSSPSANGTESDDDETTQTSSAKSATNSSSTCSSGGGGSSSDGKRQKRGEKARVHVERYHKFVLYETRARFWLIGSNRRRTEFGLLKIDRTEESALSIQQDPAVYSKAQMQELLQMIAQGNASSGGLTRRCSASGVLGFMRFLNGYYLLLITGRKKTGSIGGHAVYQVTAVTDVYIPHQTEKAKSWHESKYRSLFFSMDFSNFYYSYTYELTRTLQFNMTAPLRYQSPYNSRFVWNEFLMDDLIRETGKESKWVLPLIHGYFKQAKFSVYGRLCSVVLIARRSRHFAGTRFLKRGVNEQGQVANGVEAEQIAYEESTSMAHMASDFTSYVQTRGSIPLFWGQDGSVLAPKPPIAIQRVDPFYTATIFAL